jgi:hypothetical protein
VFSRDGARIPTSVSCVAVPLFELAAGSIRPFRRLQSAAEVYETEIEELLWGNLEAFASEPLFAVARQKILPGGGIPDIVAIDADGRIVVIEIKRDVDRSQLSQCLEYAGWARQSSLDELARIYRGGQHDFFRDWQAFTGTPSPLLLNRVPRVMLVARAFDYRTRSALEYLQENGVPVTLITVVFYEDGSGNRLVDVDAGRELVAEPVSRKVTALPSAPTLVGRRSSGVTLSDLLEANVLLTNEPIEWTRPQLGETHRATVAETGEVRLEDGRTLTSLSSAANAAGGGSNNGWICWTVPRLGGVAVAELRGRI